MTALQEVRGFPLPDRYDAAGLRQELATMGYMLHFQARTSSTMDLIEAHARSGGPPLAVAIADHQTEGRGRPGRSWYDKKGASILASVFFKLDDQSAIGPFANLIALRTCQILQQITDSGEVKIKYPNDLVYRNRKLGGLLAENIYDDSHGYVGTNVGIGINVHYTEEELDDVSFDYPGIALDIVNGSLCSRQEVLIQTLHGIRHLAPDAQVIRNGGASIENLYDKQWRANSALLDHEVIIENGQTRLEGYVEDARVRWGILVRSKGETQWVNLFDSEAIVTIKE